MNNKDGYNNDFLNQNDNELNIDDEYTYSDFKFEKNKPRDISQMNPNRQSNNQQHINNENQRLNNQNRNQLNQGQANNNPTNPTNNPNQMRSNPANQNQMNQNQMRSNLSNANQFNQNQMRSNPSNPNQMNQGQMRSNPANQNQMNQGQMRNNSANPNQMNQGQMRSNPANQNQMNQGQMRSNPANQNQMNQGQMRNNPSSPNQMNQEQMQSNSANPNQFNQNQIRGNQNQMMQGVEGSNANQFTKIIDGSELENAKNQSNVNNFNNNPFDSKKLESNNPKDDNLGIQNSELERAFRERPLDRDPNEFSDDPKIRSGERKPLMPGKKDGNSGFGGGKLPKPKPEKKLKNNGKNFYQKYKKQIKIIITILILLLLLFIGYLMLIKTFAPKVNFVVIGVDQRANKKNATIRADALMNVTASTKNNKVLLGSIPRDTYTDVLCSDTGSGKDKITHAYSSGDKNWPDKGGGIACTTQSVAKISNTSSNKYVKLNFDNMIGIINSIGGIELTPKKSFCEQDSKGKKKAFCFKKGQKKLMNGEEALAYSRHRKSDNDIQRGLRQQEVFKAMLLKVKNANILQWPGIYTKITGMVDTNLNQQELLQVALVYGGGGETENFKFDWSTFQGYDGASYVQLSDESIQAFRQKIAELQ